MTLKSVAVSNSHHPVVFYHCKVALYDIRILIALFLSWDESLSRFDCVVYYGATSSLIAFNFAYVVFLVWNVDSRLLPFIRKLDIIFAYTFRIRLIVVVVVQVTLEWIINLLFIILCRVSSKIVVLGSLDMFV